MTKIKGDVSLVVSEVVFKVFEVLIKMALGDYGELPEDTSINIAAAFGQAMADVLNRAEEGAFSAPEEAA